MIKALQFSQDYTYSITTMENKRKLIEYLYLELGEMQSNFDIVIKNLNSIYALRDETENSNLIREYNFYMKNSFIYLKTITTLITIFINGFKKDNMVTCYTTLFGKRELITKFTSFIHYVFYKSGRLHEEIDYYNEHFKNFGDLGIRIDNLHKFCFLMYSELSKQSTFIEVVDKSSVFFDKSVMLERLENSLTTGAINWVAHDTIMQVIKAILN